MLGYNPPLGSKEFKVTIQGPPEAVLAFLARGRDDSLVREATVCVAVKPDRKRPRWTESYFLPVMKTRNVLAHLELIQRIAHQIGLEHVQEVIDLVNRLAHHFPDKPRG